MKSQCPVCSAFFLPCLTDQTLDMLEFVPDAGMVATHGLGLEPSGGVLLLGLRVGVAKLAAEAGEFGVPPFRCKIAFVPVGVDLVSLAVPVEQGE